MVKKSRAVSDAVTSGLERVMARLNEEAAEDGLVLVEGRRDTLALRRAGFKGRVAALSRFRGEAAVVDEAAKARRVFLLLDLDAEGDAMTDRLKRRLSERGCKVDTTIRDILRRETLGRIRRIEELSGWVQDWSQGAA